MSSTKVIRRKMPKKPATLPALSKHSGEVVDSFKRAVVRRAQAAAQALELKSKGFVMVRDEKTSPPVLKALVGEREFARSLFGLRPIRTIMVYAATLDSSAANTSQAPVHNLDPTNSNGWSSFATVWDECRVLSVRMSAAVSLIGVALAATPTVLGVMAFDPAVAGALGSIVDGCDHTKACGPFPLSSNTAAQGGTTPGVTSSFGVVSITPVTRHGFLELHSGPLMRGALPLNNGGTLSPNPVQGDWFPTTSTTAIAGYCKFFCEAAGSNVTSHVRGIHYLDCEFRMRG